MSNLTNNVAMEPGSPEIDILLDRLEKLEDLIETNNSQNEENLNSVSKLRVNTLVVILSY